MRAVGGLVGREAVVERGEEDDRAHHVEDALLEAGEPVPSLQEEERQTSFGSVQINRYRCESELPGQNFEIMTNGRKNNYRLLQTLKTALKTRNFRFYCIFINKYFWKSEFSEARKKNT